MSFNLYVVQLLLFLVSLNIFLFNSLKHLKLRAFLKGFANEVTYSEKLI